MPHIHELYDFTASAYVLHPTQPKICLHYHKKLKSWLHLGGHIELNEDPLMALEHELEEEAGFKKGDYEFIERIDQPKAKGYKYIPMPLTLNVHPISDTHNHIDIVFLLKANKTTLHPQEGESQQIEWLDKKQIQALYKKGQMLEAAYQTCMWIFEKQPTAWVV